MPPKKPSRREIGLNKIKVAGYHGKPYQLLAIEYRISYEVARVKHAEGWRARQAGVKCNCMECTAEVSGIGKK